jgi:hypothetical protein
MFCGRINFSFFTFFTNAWGIFNNSYLCVCVCVCVCIIYVVVVYTASHYVIDLKLTLVFLFFWVVLAVQEFEVETSLLLGRHSMI